MPESNEGAEQREKFQAKQALMGEVIAMAGPRLDFSKKELLEKIGATDSADATRKFRELNLELDDLGKALDEAEKKAIADRYRQREEDRSQPWTRDPHPVGEMKKRSFGELVIEAKEYKGANFRQGGTAAIAVDVDLKTLFETGAGFAPHSPRTGLMVEGVTRPLQLTDLIPTRPMNQPVDKYMAETTRTHAAAEKGEGVAYAESTFVWTEQTSLVQKITDSLPVTDEQLQDAPEVAGVLNSRLIFGLRQRLETQILVGDGSAPNLRGFLDAGFGIQTQAKGADPVFDAIFKAMTLVRFTGRAIPGGIIMHPNDWQDVRLTRTADGQYIMGPPMSPGATSLFGVPVVICDAITENTGLVGDFANFCYIGENKGVDVQVGYVNDDFGKGRKTIRADLRACFTVPRVTAFCSVTGL